MLRKHPAYIRDNSHYISSHTLSSVHLCCWVLGQDFSHGWTQWSRAYFSLGQAVPSQMAPKVGGCWYWPEAVLGSKGGVLWSWACLVGGQSQRTFLTTFNFKTERARVLQSLVCLQRLSHHPCSVRYSVVTVLLPSRKSEQSITSTQLCSFWCLTSGILHTGGTQF